MSLLPFLTDFDDYYYPLVHRGFSDLFDVVPRRCPAVRSGYTRPWSLLPHSLSGISDVQHNKDGFRVNLDVQHFKPEEITVKVVDNSIVVEGQHEERKDDHGFVSRSFSRRYMLPKNVDAATVASSLSSDGVLQITANNKEQPGAKERVIQVTHTNQPALKGKQSEEQNQGDHQQKMEQ